MLIDTGDNRISSAVESNGGLYVEANDACVDPSNTLHACVRVMEINITANTLTGEADLGADNADWYYGAVSPDLSGNLIAVFDHSSPGTYPGIGAIAAIGPIQGENGGTFTNWTALATGTAPNESGRYGDYSGAALDWDNPQDVWVGSEVGDNLGIDTTQWASHIDSISLSESALPVTGVHQVWYPGTIYRGPTRQGWRIRIHTGGGGGRIGSNQPHRRLPPVPRRLPRQLRHHHLTNSRRGNWALRKIPRQRTPPPRSSRPLDSRQSHRTSQLQPNRRNRLSKGVQPQTRNLPVRQRRIHRKVGHALRLSPSLHNHQLPSARSLRTTSCPPGSQHG